MSGTEPPSGITGAGTIDRPYDGGNAPEQASVSGVQGKGTTNQQPSGTPVASSPPKRQGSALPSGIAEILGKKNVDANGSASPSVVQSIEKEQVSTPTTTKPTPAAPSGYFDASKNKNRNSDGQRYEERDVSPGEMRDGSHVQTSGDRGESYQPGKLNKLKDKFGFGHGR